MNDRFPLPSALAEPLTTDGFVTPYINFDTGKATSKPDSAKTLDDAAAALVRRAGPAAWFAWEGSRRATRPMAGGIHPEITLPYEREFELYHNALSLCSKKVRVCLAELGIEYRGHHVDLIETGSYENVSRRFLAVNPAALVPVLVHNGHPVYESHDIIAYAAEHAPPGAPPLVPAAADLRRSMQDWVDRAAVTGDDPTRGLAASAGNCVPGLTVPLFAAMIDVIPYRRICAGLLFHRLRWRPAAFLALKICGIERLHTLAPAVRLIARSRAALSVHLDALEAHLRAGGGTWILGAQYTLADVSWVGIFERLREADWLDVLLASGHRPTVAAYWRRLRDRPSYAAAIAAFAHPLVGRGTHRLQREKQRNAALRQALR